MQWVLFTLSFILPSIVLSKETKLLTAIWFIVFVHQLAAICNAFYFPLSGAELDAHSFHAGAVSLSQQANWHYSLGMGTGSQFFPQLLATFYKINQSHFFGEQLTIIVFLFSIFIFLKLLDLLELRKYKLSCLLLYGFYPPLIVLGSVTLREPYILLFMMLMVYFGLLFVKTGYLKHIVAAVLFGSIFSIWHPALIAIATLFLVLCVVCKFIDLRSVKKWHVIAAILTSLLILLFSLAKNYNYDFLSSLNQKWQYLSHYRERIPEARTDYGGAIDNSSLFGIISSTSFLYLDYLFSPMPWEVHSYVDLIAMISSLANFILTVGVVFQFKKLNELAQNQSIMRIILICTFLSTSFLYSIATTNYGTSLRHGVLHFWVLILLGWPMVSYCTRRFFLRIRKTNLIIGQ